MTLLEELIKDLPEKGGWPELESDVTIPDYFRNKSICWFFSMDGKHSYCQSEGVIVTRRQYEKALAASKPEWDGEGLPPVGCECEIRRVADWMPVTIKFISKYHTVFTTFGGTEDCYQTCTLQFRTIRSEADKKREEAVKEMLDTFTNALGSTEAAFGEVFDSIAAGKIPHLKIV